MRPLLFICVLLLARCGASSDSSANRPVPSPTPSPAPLSRAEEVALNEIIDQDADDDSEDRAAARNASTEFAAKLLPSWTVLGVHSGFVGKQAYRVMVDIEKGRRRETLDLMVVRFFPEDAEPYWKVRPMTTGLDSALRESEEIERLRELNRLKSRLEDERDRSQDEDPGDFEPVGDPRN